MNQLYKEDVIDIIWGSAFFSGGGGGSIANAMTLLAELSESEIHLDLASLDEMSDSPNTVAAMVAALGSPVATEDETFSTESVSAMQAAINISKLQGRELRYIYSGEQGGANTMLALFVAMKLGIPLLDVDANGRAVPELYTTLAALNGIPASPVILSSAQGDTVVVRCHGNDDAEMCEAIARDLCSVAPPGLGFAAWIMDKSQIKKALAVGQISKAQKVGHAIRNAQPGYALDAIFRCFGHFDLYEYAEGYITEINLHTEHGFDYGETVIINSGGTKWCVKFQNENLLVLDQQERVILTVPDIITIIDRETGKPYSNTETKVGQHVSVLGIQADAHWDTERGYACWKESLAAADYHGSRHPVEILD